MCLNARSTLIIHHGRFAGAAAVAKYRMTLICNTITDVDTIPVNGTWFQLIANGTTSVNLGPNGLQKLDKVVQFAEEAGVLLIMSLTNNWNPRPLLDNTTVVPVDGLARRDVTTGTNNSLPRNFLSNDFGALVPKPPALYLNLIDTDVSYCITGGIDAYVREFGKVKEHDQFFLTDGPIINIFKNYTDQIVKRYKDSPAILAWELANDPRCNSSIPGASSCNTNTLTSWHANVAQHVAQTDPNHVVSSGVGGFLCMDCQKLFPLTPSPAPSASVKKAKRSVRPVTKESVLKERRDRRKKTRELKKRELLDRGDGLRIRGRWIATRKSPLPFLANKSQKSRFCKRPPASKLLSEPGALIPIYRLLQFSCTFCLQ